MQNINARLERLEERLRDIEVKLGTEAGTEEVGQPTEGRAFKTVAPGLETPASRASLAGHSAPAPEDPVSATRFMAWCGGLMFVLATVYFLKLVYDTGWLTPERQVGLAILAACLLIGLGVRYRHWDRAYAAFLPAIGLVVFYLASLAAYPYYDLVSPGFANAGVGLVSLLGIWLSRHLKNSFYTVFAAVGVYLSPLLMNGGAISGENAQLLDLVIYYAAWSLLFSFCAIQEGRRITYLLPLYLAMLGFDFVWRFQAQGSWELAAVYQLVQFFIFSVTAGVYSIVHQQTLSRDSAIAHGLALFIFYGIEYAILKQHIPQWAPAIGVCSALVVLLLFLLARRTLKPEGNFNPSAALVSAYCSFVIVHAVFLELVPSQWLPWAVLTPGLALFLMIGQVRASQSVLLPPLLAAGLSLGYGFIALLVDAPTAERVPLPCVALVAYALVLYGAYWLFSRKLKMENYSLPLLYAGHFALMVASARAIEIDLMLSVSWSLFAVLLLWGAIRAQDSIVGQSALLIFFAAGFKLMLFDLSDSDSLVRVAALLILSASLYLGGWLYQSLSRSVLNLHPNPLINRQLNMIHKLVSKGLSDAEIHRILLLKKVEHLGNGDWTVAKVAAIARDYRHGGGQGAATVPSPQ